MRSAVRWSWSKGPDPLPLAGEIRLQVEACAVCRTDLHVVDGELPEPKLPRIPGHEIIGIVDAMGEGVDKARLGRRVGVPWLGHKHRSPAKTENACVLSGLLGMANSA